MTQPGKTASPAQVRILRRAANRKEGNVLPLLDVSGGAKEVLMASMLRKGLITDEANPCITEAGRQSLKVQQQ